MILLLVSVFGLCRLLPKVLPEPNWVITDVAQYSEIRDRDWYNETLVQHFPDEIPANATDVHVLYSVPFMQKGAYFQLRSCKRITSEFGSDSKRGKSEVIVLQCLSSVERNMGGPN